MILAADEELEVRCSGRRDDVGIAYKGDLVDHFFSRAVTTR